MTALPTIHAVVLNWNGYDDTRECITSLHTVTGVDLRIIVVDNASADDSPQRIATDFPHVELVRCVENHGIAAGYNAGIEAALAQNADYIAVLNNDLAFEPDAFIRMLDVMQRTPGCGIVMPKILYHGERNRIWSAGGYARWMPLNLVMRGFNAQDGPRWSRTEPLALAPSCALLLSRTLCEQVRFDEAYFFYYDDWDFCVAAAQAGFSLMYAGAAVVYHKVSRATQNSPKALRWWTILGQSVARYHRKHAARGLWTYVAWVAFRETVKRKPQHIRPFVAGIRAGLRAQHAADARPAWSQQS